MASPAQRDLEIRRGDTFRERFAFVGPSGRVIEDLVLTDSATAVTSASGFESTDSELAITSVDGVGIDDGTTLLVTGPTSASLSAAATATRTQVVATIGGYDFSTLTNHLAQIRTSTDAADPSAEFTIDDARADVGIFLLSLTATETAGLPPLGFWDWQAEHPTYGVVTLYEGRVTLTKDVSRD